MKSQKTVVMAVAVVATGIFALPGTISLFNGQHSWYDPGASIDGASGRNNVPCEKCHADIADVMSSGANGAHLDLSCAMCHRAPFTNYAYARGHYYIGSVYYNTTNILILLEDILYLKDVGRKYSISITGRGPEGKAGANSRGSEDNN